MTSGINDYFSGSSFIEAEKGSKVENVVNRVGLLQLPSEIIELNARKLGSYELNSFQLLSKKTNVHANDLKILYAQEFGYNKMDLFGSRKFLHEIYREIEGMQNILPPQYLAYDQRTQKLDPEATLRKLQNLTLDDCFKIFNHSEFYGAGVRKTRSYIINIANRLFSKTDMSLHKDDMNQAIQSAIRGNDVDSISLFLNQGVDIEDIYSGISNPHKISALHLACRVAQSLDVIELLLSRGANIHARYSSSDVFAFLGCRMFYNKEFCLSVAKLLLDRGANPNVGDFQGNTPLHEAALKGDTAYANLLLQHGANIHQANHAGETPLSIALKRWDFRMVNMCMLGFDPYSDD